MPVHETTPHTGEPEEPEAPEEPEEPEEPEYDEYDVYDVVDDRSTDDDDAPWGCTQPARTSSQPARRCAVPGGCPYDAAGQGRFCTAHACLHCPRERRSGSYRCTHGDCGRGDLSQP